MVKLKRNYLDTSCFKDDGILPYGRAFALSLQWLYGDEEFEVETANEDEYDRNWSYCKDRVLPICDFMSIVTDVIYMAFKDFGEPDIKNYIHLLHDGYRIYEERVLKYEGDFMIVGKLSYSTIEVILWSAYLYCHFRNVLENNKKAARADSLLYKLYARQTCLKPELVKKSLLMNHFDKTMVSFLKNIPVPDKNRPSTESTDEKKEQFPPTEDNLQKKAVEDFVNKLCLLADYAYSDYNFKSVILGGNKGEAIAVIKRDDMMNYIKEQQQNNYDDLLSCCYGKGNHKQDFCRYVRGLHEKGFFGKLPFSKLAEEINKVWSEISKNTAHTYMTKAMKRP